MQPRSIKPNFQGHINSSLKPLTFRYTKLSSPFLSESQSSPSGGPYLYEKYALNEQQEPETSETPSNPLYKDESFPDSCPYLQSDSNPMEGEDQEEQEEKLKEKNERTKLYSLPKAWTEEKDEVLLKLGTQYKGEWKRIAKKFSEKLVTPKFVKYRFKELTSAPKQKRIKFHPTEDLMLAKYYEKYGSNWTRIATHFPNRTPVMLKNRYYSYIKKQGLLGFLTEKVKEIEQSECVTKNEFDENPQIFIGSMVQEKSFCCKEETYSTSEIKVEHDAEEITALKNQVQFYQTLYFKTKFELDNLKAKVSGRTY